MNNDPLHQSLFVGADWLLYAGYDGYQHSEMLAPAVLIAQPGHTIMCHIDGQVEITSAGLLHQAGKWSYANAVGFVILYFDPVSDVGRQIQSVENGGCPFDISLNGVGWEEVYFQRLLEGQVSAAEAAQLVDLIRRAIVSTHQIAELDRRLMSASQQLTANPAGRLNLKSLASANQLSPERLRHLFKQQIGMTLSKYKSWRQLHDMCLHLAESYGRSFQWNTSDAIKHAGFYDDAHGLRTLSHYFGPRSSMTETPIHLINCLER
ncbi:helix-turn-helix transcriptional regulator [Pseudomonas sp. JM0905a]|uniref:helix-turn-helix domain-containing protein n=1 Tax=Pseudomonas sp. JM0905a TaxID=2772484 RepID=UPI0016847A91|nr:AraC family transcriptional regulator [Pseudomonas sp. JM0905a]MBD2838827.1 helix-turn-helix transcriptional regulator [Pseudomonas sp. JM0905a]